jgi:hypothetical protein
MLFPYKYVSHDMEKMQIFIDFIFHEVWCKAPAGAGCDIGLFDGNADLKEVIAAFGFTPTPPKRGKVFYESVKTIYEHFASLTAADIDQFKLWYVGNNDLEKVCANDPNVSIVRYADLAQSYPDLGKVLAEFFTGLYSQDLLDLAALRKKIGRIDEHYLALVQTNNADICPFCGLSKILGKDHSNRDAYDHYLPKAHYPFNSINFRNLVPACHHCNSSYKTSKDPAYQPKDPSPVTNRRKIFYPYAAPNYAIEISVKLKSTDIEKLQPTDIEIDFGPAALTEEIETWKHVYGIDERYKAEFCSKNAGKYWLTQVFDEYLAYEVTPLVILQQRAEQAQKNPFKDENFLRAPFLAACDAVGLFELAQVNAKPL